MRPASPLDTVAGATGVLICNEGSYGDLAAARVRAVATWLVSLANDTWVSDAQFSRMPLDMVRFRAIEQRRWVVRASTWGPSAVIDPFGRLTAATAVDAHETVAGTIEALGSITPYAGSIHDKDEDFFWPNHLAKAATLNQQAFAGYTDWRVPNVNELQSLVDYGTYNPAISPAFNTGCIPGCTVLTCSCTGNVFRWYWSSSAVESQPTRAWSVDFSRGDVQMNPYTNQAVRAVRGGS